MGRKPIEIFVVAAILLAASSFSPVLPGLVGATPSLPVCTHTTTESWSPAPGVVVTVTASACVVNFSGHYYGVHSVTSSSNSATIIPQSATWDFFGIFYACGYTCDSKDVYSHPYSTGSGQFPNLNQTVGPQKSLICAITQINLNVVYTPTGQYQTVTARSQYPNPVCF